MDYKIDSKKKKTQLPSVPYWTDLDVVDVFSSYSLALILLRVVFRLVIAILAQSDVKEKAIGTCRAPHMRALEVPSSAGVFIISRKYAGNSERFLMNLTQNVPQAECFEDIGHSWRWDVSHQ